MVQKKKTHSNPNALVQLEIKVNWQDMKVKGDRKAMVTQTHTIYNLGGEKIAFQNTALLSLEANGLWYLILLVSLKASGKKFTETGQLKIGKTSQMLNGLVSVSW